MRRLVTLIVATTLSFTAFSQTLKPTVLTIKTDTNFCFTIPQSKTIAKYLIKGQYADTLERNYSHLRHLYSRKEALQDSVRTSLQSKINKLDQVVFIQEDQIGLLEETLADRERRIKRGKWQKGALGAISTILTGIVIFK